MVRWSLPSAYECEHKWEYRCVMLRALSGQRWWEKCSLNTVSLLEPQSWWFRCPLDLLRQTLWEVIKATFNQATTRIPQGDERNMLRTTAATTTKSSELASLEWKQLQLHIETRLHAHTSVHWQPWGCKWSRMKTKKRRDTPAHL